MSGADSRTHPSLISKLQDWRDDESWREFFTRYNGLIRGVARQTGLSDSQAEDVVQEVMLKVAKCLRSWKYDPSKGHFRSWLRTVTRNCAYDYLRALPNREHTLTPAPDDGRATPPFDRIADPGARPPCEILDHEEASTLLDSILRNIRSVCNPMHFQVYDSLDLKGVPIHQVAAMTGLSRARIYVIMHRMRRLVLREIEALRVKRGDLP